MSKYTQRNAQGRYMTRTGQTGTDAYAFELAQLMNRRRELLADLEALGELIASELPETATAEIIPGIPADAESLRRWFTFSAQSLDLAEDMAEMVGTLRGLSRAEQIDAIGKRYDAEVELMSGHPRKFLAVFLPFPKTDPETTVLRDYEDEDARYLNVSSLGPDPILFDWNGSQYVRVSAPCE